MKSISMRGNKHPQWKGGMIIDREGYILIHKPDHPHHANKNYVKRAVLIMEKKLGRYLIPLEVVHHIDGDKKNDDIDNLLLFSSQGEHAYHHMKLNGWKGGKFTHSGAYNLHH